jgi:RNA polymerase sigma factor (sigma-70 family)
MKYSSEKELWLAFQREDKKAFRIIFNQYYAYLHNYGKKIIGSVEYSDEYIKDCLQDFFLYLFEHKQNLATLDKIKPYLFLAFRRFLLRKVEKDKIRKGKLNRFQNEFPAIQFSKEELLIQQEIEGIKNETLRESLNKLPKRQREIIYLRYYADLQITEISNILSISYQGVVNAIYKAMKALRKNPELLHLIRYLSALFLLYIA